MLQTILNFHFSLEHALGHVVLHLRFEQDLQGDGDIRSSLFRVIHVAKFTLAKRLTH